MGETEIEMGKEDKSKPENIRANIVKGRVEKLFKQRCLLEQPYIRDQDKTVEEVIKGAIAEIGENIQVRRFKRFNLGARRHLHGHVVRQRLELLAPRDEVRL